MKNGSQARNGLFVFTMCAFSFGVTVAMEQKTEELTKTYEKCVERCNYKGDRHARRDCITICSTVYKAHMKLLSEGKNVTVNSPSRLDVTLHAGNGPHRIMK